MRKELDHPEYQVRGWALDYAIAANDKGTSAEKIVSDAEKFYGFMFPQNGKVADLPAQPSRQAAPKNKPDDLAPPAPVIQEGAFIAPAPIVPEKQDVAVPVVEKHPFTKGSEKAQDKSESKAVINSEPQPKPRPTPLKKLTPRNLDALAAVIKINEIGLSATQKEIATRTGIGRNNISYVLKRLIERGYIAEKRQGKAMFYIALRNADGKPVLRSGDELVKSEVTGITKCPPRYASGYGYRKSEFEDIL